jgi:hypothetical protein
MLKSEIERFITHYGGCMIEEFVDGEEFTVLITDNPDNRADPIIFDPI